MEGGTTPRRLGPKLRRARTAWALALRAVRERRARAETVAHARIAARELRQRPDVPQPRRYIRLAIPLHGPSRVRRTVGTPVRLAHRLSVAPRSEESNACPPPGGIAA